MIPAAIDAHHHFWDPRRSHYPFLTDELASIRRPFGPSDLAPELEAAGIGGTVLVQTRPSLPETREFLAVAAATPFVQGVVGWVDLAEPRVADTIAEIREGPGGDKLVAIRHQLHDEPDTEWVLRPAVLAGIAEVGRAGLVYDVLIRPREMPFALEAIRRSPNVRFVVDHLAKPPIASGALEPWASLLREFGREPQVACKISGMVTEADWSAWRVDDLRPYVAVALEAFGPDRLLFGSDWPVCLVAATYGQVVGAAREALDSLSPDEATAVFGGTARRVYGLAS